MHKHLFEGLAREEAVEMQASGQNVEIQKTLPTHRGQSLQMIVTEQCPGPHNVIFLPGPAVGPWITEELHSSDWSGSECRMLDDEGNPWPRGQLITFSNGMGGYIPYDIDQLHILLLRILRRIP